MGTLYSNIPKAIFYLFMGDYTYTRTCGAVRCPRSVSLLGTLHVRGCLNFTGNPQQDHGFDRTACGEGLTS